MNLVICQTKDAIRMEASCNWFRTLFDGGGLRLGLGEIKVKMEVV